MNSTKILRIFEGGTYMLKEKLLEDLKIAMKEKLLKSINALLDKCEDMALLDFILKLLQKSR